MVFFSHVEMQLAFSLSMLFAKISDQSMSTERLSSCNTLVGGVSRVIEMEDKNPKGTQAARDAITAKIKAIPCTYCTCNINVLSFKCVCRLSIYATAHRHLKRRWLLCRKLWRQDVQKGMQKRNQPQAPHRMSSRCTKYQIASIKGV